MTKQATELLLSWALNKTLSEQESFAAFLEKEMLHYSEPKHGGLTGRVMEALLDHFEKNYIES